MLNARQAEEPTDPPTGNGGGEVVVFPLRGGGVPFEFGRRAEEQKFSLLVDLSAEEMGWRWCRGAATLALLCGAALLLAPGFERRAPAAAAAVEVTPQTDLSSLAMQPMLAPPPSGASESALPPPVGIASGERDGVKRVSGGVTDGLYWSLRGAGASPELAADYLKAVADYTDVGEVAPFDRFEFIVAADGDRLLYAGLDRFQGDDVELLRWSVGGRSGWYSAGALVPSAASGLMAPVAGRITSRFGSRRHPILRYTRFHGGVDFGARWGSPIVAAADGQVVAAGRAGGYGRQVRVAHGNGIVTSYSHMSEIAASPGAMVRQGQLIGYVGSSGLSTGPHLHFEVRVGGRAVDPLTARLIQRPAIDGRELAAFKARLKVLKSIPLKGPGAPGAAAS